LNHGKLGTLGPHGESINLGEHVQHLAVRTKILKDAVTRRLIEEDVNPDHLTLCVRRAKQGQGEDESGCSKQKIAETEEC
jgi:hypothetical protein